MLNMFCVCTVLGYYKKIKLDSMVFKNYVMHGISMIIIEILNIVQYKLHENDIQKYLK